MIEGGCFCGKIRFTIADGDYPVVNCHCTMCRRTSAAPFVTWLVVPKSAIGFSGEPPKRLKSSDNGTRQFCGHCGTPMTFSETKRPDHVDVTVGSLDQPEKFVPTKAVFGETRLPWLDKVL